MRQSGISDKRIELINKIKILDSMIIIFRIPIR